MSTKPRQVLRLGHVQLEKLDKLLDMEYTAAELEEETTIPAAVIRGLIKFWKLPARKIANGRYWIHGLAFANWVRERSKNKSRQPAGLKLRAQAANEFYCVSCRLIVKTETTPGVEHLKRWDNLKTICPVCFGGISKFVRREATKYPRKERKKKPPKSQVGQSTGNPPP